MIWLLLLVPLILWEVYRELRTAAARRAAVRSRRAQLASEFEDRFASNTNPNTEK